MNNKKLSDSELEIMLTIWKSKHPINSSFLMEELKDKKWAKSTILNFLYRLEDKGYLKCEKKGRVNIYMPIIMEHDYFKKSSTGFLQKLFGNSIKNMVAELYSSNTITDKELEELKKFIDDKSNEKV